MNVHNKSIYCYIIIRLIGIDRQCFKVYHRLCSVGGGGVGNESDGWGGRRWVVEGGGGWLMEEDGGGWWWVVVGGIYASLSPDFRNKEEINSISK